MRIKKFLFYFILLSATIPCISLFSKSLDENLKQSKLLNSNGLITVNEALDLTDKADELKGKGNYESAIELYKRYIKDINPESFSTLDEIHAYFIIIQEIAGIYNDEDDIKNAILYYYEIKNTYHFFEKQLSSLENLKPSLQSAFSKEENLEYITEIYDGALDWIGLLNTEANNYQDAIAHYSTVNSENSKEKTELSDDFLNRKSIEINNMIIAEMYNTAEHEATDIIKRIEDEGATENIYYEGFLVDLLTIYQQLKLYDNKWDIIQKLKEINQEDYLAEEASTLFFKKDYEKAAVAYEKLCNRTKKTDPQYFAHVIGYSQNLSLIGQTEKAILILTAYLNFVRNNFTSYIDGVITFLAYLHYENKEFDKALEYYEEFYKKHTDNPALVSAYALPMSSCYLKTSKFDKADKFLQDAIEASKNSILYTLMFFTEENRKDYLGQISYYTDAVLTHLDVRYNENNFISSAVCDYMLLMKEIGLNTIRSVRKESVNSENKEYHALYNKWMDSRALLLNPTILANKDSLKDYTRACEKEIIKKLSQGIINNDKFKEIHWQNIQEKLHSDEAAIEYVVYNNQTTKPDNQLYGALIITKTCKTPYYINLCSDTELDGILKIKDGVSEKSKVDLIYNKRVVDLSNLIWKPIEPLLSNISKIYYSPAGLLHSVSFNSLTNSDNKRLDDTYILSRLNNTYYVVDKPLDLQFKSISLFGGMDYSIYQNSPTLNTSLNRGFNGAFSPLPNTLVEINALEQILKSNKIEIKKFYDENAVEEKFIEEVLQANDILHISTHAFYLESVNEDELFATELYGYGVHKMDSDPMNRSGIVFSGANYYWETGESYMGKEDGIVTANDIANLNLSKTKLVVLSACETGIGENTTSEGVYGMQRAFKLAGVNHLILSLWKVDDSATQEFMELFYNYLLNGDSIEESMMQARLKLKEKHPDPYYWGAFEYIR